MSNQNIIVAVLIVGVLGVGLWFALSMNEGRNPFSSKEIVATVNGEKITNDNFRSQLAQVKKMGLNLKEKELKSRVLDQMIGDVLIEQKIEEKGMSVEERKVDAQMSQVIQQVGGEKAFKQQLKKAGITKKELRKRIRDQLLVQKYIRSEVSAKKLKVTDQEVETYFKQMMSQQENATDTPSFEEIGEKQKEQIKSQLKQQKRNRERQNLIETLKKKAKIEKML